MDLIRLGVPSRTLVKFLLVVGDVVVVAVGVVDWIDVKLFVSKVNRL